MITISRKDAVVQGLNRYFTGTPCKNGHLSEKHIAYGCIQCNSERCKTKSPEQIHQKREWDKSYYHNNKEKHRENDRVWKSKNKEKNKINKREYQRKVNKTPQGKASIACYNLLKRVSANKTDSTHVMLGYTRDELITHMESLFTEGMTWDNHGAWHIDHIKPVIAFVKEGIDDPKIINALSNLQPLWAEDNMSKSGKYLT